MAVPTKMLDEVQDIMSSKEGINQQVEQVVQLLESYGMAHRMTILPSQLLCHPDNRGGAMVSFHDVWQKGLQMVQVGLQKTLLQDAICIELSKAEDKKAMQIQQNKKLVEASMGHLAPVTGKERLWAFFIICSFLILLLLYFPIFLSGLASLLFILPHFRLHDTQCQPHSPIPQSH